MARSDAPLTIGPIGGLGGGPQSASNTLCNLINSVPPITIGDVTISQSPSCTATNYDNFYYLGEDTWRPTILGGPTYSSRANAMADALYCALKDTGGGSADATVDAPGLGAFGMYTHANVYHSDPTTMSVSGQRLGTLYAFGAGLDVEDQDFVATFPRENTYVYGVHNNGYYMDLQSSTATWGLTGSGQIGPFTLSVSVGQNGVFASENNNLFDWSGSQKNTPNSAFTWSTMENACTACLATAGPLNFCPCPTSQQVAEHNQFASWTGAQYRNLSDGIFPYSGDLGGTSGNYIYLDSSQNWTDFGPALGGVVTGDIRHSVNGNPSTSIDVHFGFDYDIIDLDLHLGVQFLSAMELTQSHLLAGDAPNHAGVQTTLDAGFGVTVDGQLSIANPFPFGPNPLLNETFNIYSNKKSAHNTQVDIEYDGANGFPFYTYGVRNQAAQNPTTAQQNCLSVPPVNNSPVTPSTPQSWLQQVANNANNALYPCNVKLCQPSSATSTAGTMETCQWDMVQKKLSCTNTGQACTVCQDTADLCDASGQVYIPVTTHNSYGACGTQ